MHDNHNETLNHNDNAINDLDKTGYLQKKTTKGIWVNRYFVTDRNYLSYWHTQAQYDNKEDAAETFDLSEVKNMETQGTKVFILSFQAAGKFKVELSAGNDQERREWMGIIEGKRRLYSVDELLADIRAERISFRTKSFQVLMMLQERDQNKWILDRIDEGFHISSDESQAAKLRGDSSALLQAAIRVVDEFILVCRDGEAEMTSRSPKIMAHSRNYVKRYSDILKGRIALELLYLPGITERHFELLGEKALCYSLEFLHRLDIVHQFPFVPREFTQTLHRSLFSFGEIISSLLNLGMKRVDIFFEQLPSFTPFERCVKLYDGISLFVTSLLLVQHHLSTSELFCLVTQKLLSTQVLSVADHLQEFASVSRETQTQETPAEVILLEGYEESILLQHMESIYHWQQATSEIRVDVATRTIYHPATALRDQTSSTAALPSSLQLMQTATNLTQTLQSVASTAAATDNNSNNNNTHCSGADNSSNSAGIVIKVPASELEAFHFACDASARAAMVAIVRRYYSVPSQHLLLQHLFQEQHDGWLGGILITAWLNQVHTWSMYIVSSLPVFLKNSFIQEVCRIALVMYWQRLVMVYQHHPSSKFSLSKLTGTTSSHSSHQHINNHGHHPTGGMFSEAGVLQVQDDCRRMQDWMRSLQKSTTESSSVTTSDTAEMMMLNIWQGFVNISDPIQQVLPLFVDSIYQCGLPCVLYLYDILRLFLKMKKSSSQGSLMTDNQRHVALAICEEFIYQLLQQPGVKDDGLLPGIFNVDNGAKVCSSASTKSSNNNNNNANMNGNGYVRMLPVCEALCPELLSRHVFVTGSKWKWLSRSSLMLLFSLPLVSLGSVSSVSSTSVSGKHSDCNNINFNSSKLISGGSPSLYSTSHKQNVSTATTANTSGLITDAHALQVTLQVTELCNRALAQRRTVIEQSQSIFPSISQQTTNKGSSDHISGRDYTSASTAETPATTCPPPRPARRRSSAANTTMNIFSDEDNSNHNPSTDTKTTSNTNASDETIIEIEKTHSVLSVLPPTYSDHASIHQHAPSLPSASSPPSKPLPAHLGVNCLVNNAMKHSQGGYNKPRPPPPPPPPLPHPYTHTKPPAHPTKVSLQTRSVFISATVSNNLFSSETDTAAAMSDEREHESNINIMNNVNIKVVDNNISNNNNSNNKTSTGNHFNVNNIDSNPAIPNNYTNTEIASTAATATNSSTEKLSPASPLPISPAAVGVKPPSWATDGKITSMIVPHKITTPTATDAHNLTTQITTNGVTKNDIPEPTIPTLTQKRRNTVFGTQSENNNNAPAPVAAIQPSWYKPKDSVPTNTLSPPKNTIAIELKQEEKTNIVEANTNMPTSVIPVASIFQTSKGSQEENDISEPFTMKNMKLELTESEKQKLPPPSKPQRRASASPVLMTTNDNYSNSSATTSPEDLENMRRQEALRKLLAQAQAQVKTPSSPVTIPP